MSRHCHSRATFTAHALARSAPATRRLAWRAPLAPIYSTPHPPQSPLSIPLIPAAHALARSDPVTRRLAWGPSLVAGLLLFGGGLAFETIADWQKFKWKSDPGARVVSCLAACCRFLLCCCWAAVLTAFETMAVRQKLH